MAARCAPLCDPKKSEFLLDSDMYLLSLSLALSQHLDNWFYHNLNVIPTFHLNIQRIADNVAEKVGIIIQVVQDRKRL